MPDGLHSNATAPFFTRPLANTDLAVATAIQAEDSRQRAQIELIAPKNYMSRATRDALASIMAFTSVEGYPGRRYHAGVINIDEIERIAIARAKQMFDAAHANVQPHSGTQANQAVYFAVLDPGDTVLSMALAAGGHLSHGLKTNLSGKWFRAAHYGVTADGFIDYDQMRALASALRPKLIIVGGSSYPRVIDFCRVAGIAAEIGAYTMADVAHFSGLIVGGCYPNPMDHIDFVTSTTNKNLRGPRGGVILARSAALGKRIDAALFPGVQGGPLPEMITAKAVCFGEALTEDFRTYAASVLGNARALSATLVSRGYAPVTGGTDTPLVVVDLRPQRLKGDAAQHALEIIGLTCNRNLVPGDTETPNVTSGLRFGTSAVTTRGMDKAQMEELGGIIADVLDCLADGLQPPDRQLGSLRERVAQLAHQHPLYP